MNNRNNCRCRLDIISVRQVCGVWHVDSHFPFVCRSAFDFIHSFFFFLFSVHRSPAVIAQTVIMIRISIILLFIHLSFLTRLVRETGPKRESVYIWNVSFVR